MQYVISDIHGEYDLFMRLLEKINFSTADTLYCLGDFIDKGERPLSVMRFVQRNPNIIALLGNHEVDFLSYFYNLLRTEDEDMLYYRLSDYLEEEVTESDMEFLDGLPLYIETEQCIFVHAGVEIDEQQRIIPMEQQKSKILIYDRRTKESNFLIKNSKTLFYGHTPTFYLVGEPRIIKYPRIGKSVQSNSVADFYKVHLDTGAYVTATLGCICLDDMQEFYVHK